MESDSSADSDIELKEVDSENGSTSDKLTGEPNKPEWSKESTLHSSSSNDDGQGKTNEPIDKTKTNSKRRKKKRKFILASSNVVSQFLFLWIVKLMRLCSEVSDIRKIHFVLRDTETARVTGDALEAIWKEEMYQFGE